MVRVTSASRGLQLWSRTVNSAPFVNPALKTVMNRPGFIPPTQTQLTANVKVGVSPGNTDRQQRRLGMGAS